MADTPKGISVSRQDDRIYVRVVGRGTFQNSQPLQQFAGEMIEQGEKEFVVDLEQCQGMDSTFLGVLAGIGLRLREIGCPSALRVINIGGRQMESLRTLGLDRLFDIQTGRQTVPEGADFCPLADADVTQLTHPLTKEEAANLILEAHNNLVRADKRNALQFRELTRSLREAIDRRRARGRDKE
ncbi:MAG TPA: STAS domain-containing protein [Verrucomicrobiae bacterium]|nr:STAS domain-containing protein [Verrucomicrobiae bacterium]